MPGTWKRPWAAYAGWLHGRWPAGTVEKLPIAGEDGRTNLPGVFVVGDLSGIPLLKFAADTGARAVRAIVAEESFRRERLSRPDDVLDLLIVGAGVSGMAAALEARRHRLSFAVVEARRRFQTIADFPRGKTIYTYPRAMTPAGDLRLRAEVKEDLLAELQEQTDDVPVTEGRVTTLRRRDGSLVAERSGAPDLKALRVVVAIGRSGNYRKLGVPGEASGKVHNRLHDPRDHRGRRVLVVGGGDSAVEAALALAESGAAVTLSYRKERFARAKPENRERLLQRTGSQTASGNGDTAPSGGIRLALGTEVKEIRATEVVLENAAGAEQLVPNDVVFSMIGREAPLGFFRRAGIRIAGEWNARRVAALAAFLVFCFALYNWKSGGFLDAWTREAAAFPYNLVGAESGFPEGSLPAIALRSAQGPAFWYTLAYSLLVVIFGVRRIARRRTPYVTVQTVTLMAIQVGPLFLLPEILLPWLDARGWLPAALADSLFPAVDYGHGREFWRAYGLILAWPLNVYNVMTAGPLWGWLAIAFVQTFVLIPLLVYRWGKGAYCGWICSCGALAETLGDGQRRKMPHGSGWNRLNLAGQVVLALALLLLLLRILAWVLPGSALGSFTDRLLYGPLGYKWVVDVFLAGVVGYGVYFWLSGRFWCRFLCPLAALMHVYARFSRFRIFADKKKCISCNVCTSVCHQGIDVMNFANKGLPMADPQCVRCSACVASCPTGVLTFGRLGGDGELATLDRLRATPLPPAER